MEILGLEVPEGQRLFVWTCGDGGGFLFFAKDEDEAFRRALASRCEGGEVDEESVAKQVGWFRQHDSLVEVVGEVTAGPLDAKLVKAAVARLELLLSGGEDEVE